MANQDMLLSALKVKRERDPGLYFDGRGLYLQVTGAGAKSWIYRYTLKGKAHWQGLGSAQHVSLQEARQARDDAKSKVVKGIDPVEEKRAERNAAKAAKHPPKIVTFKGSVERYLEDNHDSWSNPKHRAQWRSTLQTYAYPVIADLPVNAIMAAHIVEILRPIWRGKNETARRVRGRIEAVLDYAADPDDHGFRNPACLTERLKKALPKFDRKPKHHAALPHDKIAAFMVDLHTREAIAARALEFVILTAARTSEALRATWDEIDTGDKLWIIPAKRMKAGKEHRVPLSDASLLVLDQMAAIRQNDFIFSGMKPGWALSDMAMLKMLERMGYPDLTVHGFRSTFRDWAGERANLEGAREAAEAALAHVVKDKTERAYVRTDLFEKRKILMSMWAEYCGTPTAIPVHAATKFPG